MTLTEPGLYIRSIRVLLPVSEEYERQNLAALRWPTNDQRMILEEKIINRQRNGEGWTRLSPGYCFRGKNCFRHNDYPPEGALGTYDSGHDSYSEVVPALIHIYVWPREETDFDLLIRTMQDEYLHFWLDANEGRITNRALDADEAHKKIDL